MTKENLLPFNPSVTDVLESIMYDLVNTYFEDEAKTQKWFKTKNPLLGNVTPISMCKHNKHGKLLMFIREALDENKRDIK